MNETSSSGDDSTFPQKDTTARLALKAQASEASAKRAAYLQEKFGIDLDEWFIRPRGAWEVTALGEAESHAGAMLGDLAVLCDAPDRHADVDASVKSRDNFRGVYTSRTEPKLRCYFFAPLGA